MTRAIKTKLGSNPKITMKAYSVLIFDIHMLNSSGFEPKYSYCAVKRKHIL